MDLNQRAKELAQKIKDNAMREMKIAEDTCAGAVAAVAAPMNSGDDIIRRQKPSKKKSKKKVSASIYESARHGVIHNPDEPDNPTIEVDGYASVDLVTLKSMLTRHFDDLKARADRDDWSNLAYILDTGVIQLKLDAMKQALAEIEERKNNEDVEEGFSRLPSIDRERYTEIDGLEGPYMLRNGRVVYYDPREGKYYDRDTDMYIPDDEYFAADRNQPFK